MKKENRTISAFRHLLMAALCCVLPVAASSQTKKNTTPTSPGGRIYYLPLNDSESKEGKPVQNTDTKKKASQAAPPKTRKTKTAETDNRMYYLPLNNPESKAENPAAETKTPKKKQPKAPKTQVPADAANRVYYLPLNNPETTPAPENAKKDSSTVKRKRRTAKAAADSALVKTDTAVVKKKRRATLKAAPDSSAVKPDTAVVMMPVNDSVQPKAKRHFMPTRRRIDREVEKNKFVYKGETMMGLTISYGTLNTDNADMFPIFEEINVGGSIVTLNPYIGYFYRDNNCFGVRFGYTHVDGTLDSFGVNLGEQNDIELDIPWIDLSSRRFSASAFHRTYVGIDEKCRFGAFGELELSYTNGDNMFAYKSGDRLKHTRSKSQSVRVLFSPGVAVYALPNVSASVSFGLGGFKYTFTQQYDENDVKTGKRHYSNLNFRLNLLDIRIGLTFHLWNAKKSAKRAFVKP